MTTGVPDDGVKRNVLGHPRGEPKPYLGTDQEREERDAVIAAAADRGIRYLTLAKQYGLSKRQIIRIVQAQRDQAHAELVADANPMTFIKETLGQYEAGIEELAMLSASTDHPSVKVAAIRTRIEAVKGRLELLQAVGVVPKNLGSIRVESDAREMARAIADVLSAYEMPDEITDAIIDVIEGREVQLPQRALPSG